MTLASTINDHANVNAAAWRFYEQDASIDGSLEIKIDPLAEDEVGDAPLFTTERRLQRLAIVACDTGARFAREGIKHDAAAWMLAPRELFGGARPIDACQGRGAFVRATLLHGLSLGLDADPAELDALLEQDDEVDALDPIEEVPSAWPASDGTMRLFTCTVEGRFGSGGRCIQAFCAMVATNEAVVRRRLNLRYGERLGAAANVEEGFDAESELAKSLLSPNMAKMLSAIARDPAGEMGAGLDIQVEQRFAA